MTTGRDRRQALLDQSPPTLNGIDYLVVARGRHPALEVHFLNRAPISDQITRATLSGPAGAETLTLEAMRWAEPAHGPPVLTLPVESTCDAARYRLTLNSPALDPVFSTIEFSFVAGEVTALDCARPLTIPAQPAASAPPIDYLVKDFLSFRKALSDFSTLSYPAWQERSEADFGVMFMEALCALADDLSYQQDRIAAEAYLATASERISVTRRARLVGYEPQPALAARTVLRFTVQPGVSSIGAGQGVYALAADGTSINFETGLGLADTTDYPVSAQWNAMLPYWWDDATRTLAAGATELWLSGDTLDLYPGMTILIGPTFIDAASANGGMQETAQIASATPDYDPLYEARLTRVRLQAPLAEPHDLASTTISGNLTPATQGQRRVETFVIPPQPPDGVAAAGSAAARGTGVAARQGPNDTTVWMYTLANTPLTWLAGEAPFSWTPEIALTSVPSPLGGDAAPWTWLNSLIDAAPYQPAFTVDPARYAPTPPELADGVTNLDYDGAAGDTLRFGDGVFGEIAPTGSVFTAAYRSGGGAVGNVAANSITFPAASSSLGQKITSVTNPFAATGGADAESLDSVRRLAPYAYQSLSYNAMLGPDFAAAAQSLPWVARAGCTVRHSGSWLTAFTSAEATDTDAISEDQLDQLTAVLNRRHVAGYDSYALAPSYASLDLRIAVLANSAAFNSDVAAALLVALGTGSLANGSPAFFAHGNFTFGQPLERSALEAAIQAVQGVAGIASITVRRSGAAQPFGPLVSLAPVADNEVIRVDNDPASPTAGSLFVSVSGGK